MRHFSQTSWGWGTGSNVFRGTAIIGKYIWETGSLNQFISEPMKISGSKGQVLETEQHCYK